MLGGSRLSVRVAVARSTFGKLDNKDERQSNGKVVSPLDECRKTSKVEYDAPSRGIRHNRNTHFSKPKISLRQIVLRYILFPIPPLLALLVALVVQLLPLKLLWDGSLLIVEKTLQSEAARGIDVSSHTLRMALAVGTVTAVAVQRLLQREEEEEVHHQSQGEPKKTVCVIGAGISGIVTAKECLEQGHNVTVLERSGEQGGVWRSRAWGKTMLTSSNMNTSFSDFIFPEVFVGNEHVGFATRDQFLSYLDSYAMHFNVGSVMKLQCEVVDVTKKGEGYTVKWNEFDKNGKFIRAECRAFDAVAVCSGLPNEPRQCPLKNAAKFEGTISHSKTYTTPEPFRGKRVLVVGTGESASDIVSEVSEISSKPVAVSQHTPTLVLHRDHWESPPDYAENRLLHLCPALARWAYLKCLFLLIVFFGDLTTCLHKMPKAFTWLRFLVFYKLPIDIRQPTAMCSVVHVTKSGCMLAPISSGKAEQLPAADRCTGGKTIMFEDGSTAEYDHIILANGYIPTRFPFLEKLGLKCSNARERYHLTFHPDHQNLAFVGFTRGQVGALTTLIEMQARWFALLVSGRRTLPPAEAMKRRIHSINVQTRGKYMTRSSWFAANYLARHEFRLNGPGAKPELALAAYESVQLYTNIPGERVHRALMIIIAVVSQVLWSILEFFPLPAHLVMLLNGCFMPNTSEIY